MYNTSTEAIGMFYHKWASKYGHTTVKLTRHLLVAQHGKLQDNPG
jgi:hypothetical protein